MWPLCSWKLSAAPARGESLAVVVLTSRDDPAGESRSHQVEGFRTGQTSATRDTTRVSSSAVCVAKSTGL